ncbi:hypothetical protein PENANT_c010G04360 [Penicillium antarcticum]|uniref:Cytochrome P450 n=1 Tax=Penicillium antarcticum TaxID=416450 RepID=A0A1V6Q802_9EURO|nr:uncharacterized protein N7508_000579 [Penicillium antarcticum]KAJ5320296.1 hypothetical protein N7508_000579 [Penicillium antarcticum]OQD85363.1 hypothetical protein PENANT_c010G04360 [Penicillium antarcticum]
MKDLQDLSTVCVTTAVGLVCLTLVVRTWIRPERVPLGIEWAGRRQEFFGDIRACMREYTGGLKTMLLGYKKFNLRGKPFILPGTGFEPHVMLPPEFIKWLIDQPEGVLSHRLVQGEKLGLKYLLPAFDYTSDMAIIEAIRVHLTRNLGKVQGDLFDEMRHSVDQMLGLDETESKEVNLYDTLNEIVFKASGRILFGQDLTRNEKFMHYVLKFATWFGMGTVLIGQLVPWQFRRLVGSLCAIPTAYYRSMCANHLWPLFAERYENMQRKRDDPTFDYSPPENLITWMYRAAFDTKDQEITSGKPLAARFTVLVAGAIATSVVTSTNALLDLLGSDPDQDYYRLLREESEAVFLTESDWNNSTSLLKLHRLDSTIRESLRRHPIILRGLSRQVMPKDGVTLPNGQNIPQGAWLGFPVPAIQNDSRYYNEPDVYTPFRFLPTETTKRTMLVTTSDTFLPFGHARHSCPGRWFASHLMKLLFAYITIHYDIEPLKERPLNMIVGDHPIPPPWIKIRVRRRARYT